MLATPVVMRVFGVPRDDVGRSSVDSANFPASEQFLVWAKRWIRP
jgi:hypothetical protein